MTLRALSLFSGIGGIDLGLAPYARTVCYVENNPYCVDVLRARQRDGRLHTAPIWDDVTTFDGNPWRGSVDLIHGGFPCQDISAAGKGAGITGQRSGLWSEFARIIREVRPRFVFVENVAMLLVRGIDTVLGDLAESGYDARWLRLSAADVGAPHRRQRIFILANHSSQQVGAPRFTRETDGSHQTMANAERVRELQPQGCESNERRRAGNGDWWSVEPDVGRVAHAVPRRVHRLKALGNAVVPAQARKAWEILTA